MLTPTTELDAVNEMLSMIGELPVANISNPGISEAGLALDKLRNVSKAVQGRGLHCNSEENYPLPIDNTGQVSVPPNAQVLRATDGVLNVAQRGSRLYDKDGHTYTFKSTVFVDIVFLLDFEDLPEDARLYIAIRAGRMFIREQLGSDGLSRLTAEDEMSARVEFQANEEIRMQNNMLYSSRTPGSMVRRGTVLGRV